MGIVYRAQDTVFQRLVALKTVRGTPDPDALELFQKERNILKEICHPNIVDILDIGELTEDGERKPFFVMPFLRGTTLDGLIKSAGSLLSPERVIEIIAQVCRGLQAAHEQGIIHRDLKPSNLYVLPDDSVKIIDFGIVHLAGSQSRTGMKGTLPYMAPEQIEFKPVTAQADIFSLGVVCFQALTGRNFYARPTEEETLKAIRFEMPPPVSDLNPAVNDHTSQVVQKALAKSPYARFSSAREFGEYLQRSLRNDPIELFDRSRIKPRLKRIRKALDSGDYRLALEILSELESEGIIDPDIPLFRVEAERAMRAKTVQQLLEDARTRMEEEEYPLALQKVQSVLEIEPDNVDALALKSDIDRERSAAQIQRWRQIARQHIDNRLFGKARQAVEEILRIDPAQSGVREMLAEISKEEEKLLKVRQEKQQLFDSAHKAYNNGELSSALRLLERVIELGRTTPGHPNTDARYLEFYEQVRRAHDEFASTYADAKRAVTSGDFDNALELCNRVLARRPREPLIQALKIEVEDLKRQRASAAVAEVHSRIEAEADLERKFQLLKAAVKQFPGEQAFLQMFKVIEARRNLVNDIVRRARHYESQGQFVEASSQWETLRTIYAQYPNLDYEVQRLGKKQDEYVKNQARAKQIGKIDYALLTGEYQTADELLSQALAESPDDEELLGLKRQCEQGTENSNRAQVLLAEADQLTGSGNHLLAIERLRDARLISPNNPLVLRALNSALLECARTLAETDWEAALPFLDEAHELNPDDPKIAGISQLIADARLHDRVEECLARARDLREHGKIQDALAHVEEMLRETPGNSRLLQLGANLRAEQRQSEAERTIPVAQVRHAVAAAGSSVAPASETETSTLARSSYPESAKPVAASQPPPSPPRAQGPVLIQPLVETPDRLTARRNAEESKPFFNRRNVALGGGLLLVLLLAMLGLQIHRPTPKSNPGPPPDKGTSARSITASGTSSTGTTSTGPTTEPKPPEPSKNTAAPVTPHSKKQTNVFFRSDPSPAHLTFDGADDLYCDTPCPIDLTNTRHTFTATAPGFSELKGTINVPDDTTKYLTLLPETKSVTVSSTPNGVAFSIDGKPMGVTPKTVRLSPGEHLVKFGPENAQAEKKINVSDEDIQSMKLEGGDVSPVQTPKPTPTTQAGP